MNQKKSRLKLFIITTVIFLLTGISMAFFFHKDEHLITGVWYSGDITYESYGYEVTEQDGRNHYEVAAEDAYLDIYIDKKGYEDKTCDNIIIRFQSIAEKDELIKCYILDENNEPVCSVGSPWDKRGAYIRMDLSRADESAREVLSKDKVHARAYIDESFTMPMIYVSIPDDSFKICIIAIIAALILAPIAGVAFTFIKPLRWIAEKIGSGIKKILEAFSRNSKAIGKHLEGFAVCFIGSMIVTILLSSILDKEFSIALILTVFLPVSFIYMIIFMRDIFIKKIEIFGTLTVLIIGTIYAFAAPPTVGVNYDDMDHYAKVVSISSFLENRMSLADWDGIVEARSAMVNGDVLDEDVQLGLVSFRNDMDKGHFYVGSGIGLNAFQIKHLSYITSIIPYFFCKLLHLPWIVRFLAGRWGTVIFLAIVTYYSMKSLRSGKMIAFMCAAMPGVLFLAASYSYDVWLIGCIMLGLSIFFGEKQDKDSYLSLKKAIAIAILFCISNVSKPIYFPLFMVAFFMPMYKFKEKKQYWLYKLLIVVSMMVPILLVLIGTLLPGVGDGDTRGGEGVNATLQLQGFMQNPMQVIMVILRFLSTYLNPFYQRTSWFNRLGYMGRLEIGIYGAIVLLICSFISVNRKEPAKFPWWYRLGVLAVYGVIGFLAAFSMYIAFTPVGADTVNGCQARYILPAVFPVLFACTRWSAEALFDRFPELDDVSKKTVLGCPMSYIKDVVIATLFIIPNVMGLYLYMIH